MSPLAKRLADKTVVVLGAAGNLGPVWVEAVLAEGAKVVACGLRASSDSVLKDLASRNPDRLVAVDVDLTDLAPGSLESVTGALRATTVDGLVLNAGIDSVPGTGKQSFADYAAEEWQRVFAVNVFGVVAFINAMIPQLSNPSSVVTLGSMYGIVSPKPAMYSHFNNGQGSMKNPAYGASKAALLAVTKQYATYLAPQGIRVNMLTLGGVVAGQDAEFVAKFESHVPQGRMVPRDELPASLIYLLSSDSASMTGHNLVIDGGYTAW